MKAIRDILWAERSREEFPAFAERGAVVVVPVGSTEQHGVALPVNTDTRDLEYVTHRGACLAEDVPVLVTPTIAVAISPHHMMFPGAITLRVETLVRVLTEYCESIVHHGFDRILILNGHGGNANTVGAAALELKFRMFREIRALTWWDLIPDTFREVLEGPSPGIGHAGEAEASCILALAPEAVRRERMVMVPGISDDPSLARASKGERILNAAAEALAGYLRLMAAAPGRDVVGVEPARK